MQPVLQRGHDDHVVRRRVGGDVERVDRAARDQLFMVGENGGACTEDLLGNVGGGLGGLAARVADGDSSNLRTRGPGERAVPLNVPAAHPPQPTSPIASALT